MPGSCDSEQSSSPSLISSLRRFRFQNKSKHSQPSDTPSQSSSSSGQPVRSAEQSLSQHSSSTAYNPLSYRKYENPSESFALLHNVYSKIQASFKNNTNSTLDLVLTSEETKKLKDTVLQESSVSVKWSSNVTQYAAKDCNGNLLKIKRLFMFELSKYISSVLSNKSTKNSGQLTSGKLPKKASKVNQREKSSNNSTVINNSMSSEDQTQVAMDDYEEFCEKEQCLRKMLDSFPGADIMEAQDILVKCQWNLKKAIIEAQNQPLKTTRKRGLSGSFVQQPNAVGNVSNQQTVVNPQQNPTSEVPEEIVLDSSDEDELNGVTQSDNFTVSNNKPTQNVPPAKRARRVISTDSEDEAATSAVKSLMNAAYQKSQLTVSHDPQKPSLSVQSPAQPRPSSSGQSSSSQKPSSSVQPPVPQKPSSSVQLPTSQKSSSLQSPASQKPSVSLQPSILQNPSSSLQPSVLQKSSSFVQSNPVRTSNNDSNSSSEKIIVPQTLSIKPIPGLPSANNEKTAPSMPSLPKGLVITQVGSADNLSKKSENEGVSVNGSHTANIPSNSNKHAHLVRIKSPDTAVNTSTANKVITIPISKGVSITPISKTVNVIPITPKALSITPVSNAKEPSVRDKLGKSPIISSTEEDDSSSEMKSKPNNHAVKHVDVKNYNISQDLEESNDADQLNLQERGISEARKGGDGLSKKKAIPGKHEKISFEDDDDEEYGNDDIYDSEDSDCDENLTSAHSAVLKFFQESSAEELGTIPGCSKKKVETIMNLRPFTKWLDLVEKLKNDKALSTDLLNGAKKVLDMRNAITKLMTKCQRISLDMGDLVENLKENKESSSGYVNKQPELLNERMHLTAYQMLGLNWLLLMHNQEVNAILADEMGLGKTIQAIAFLAYLKEIEEEGPHLIVVPSSTLDNWRKEMETWWPSVSVICYHGSQESRRELRMQVLNDEVEEFDVMLTTYNMVTSSTEDRNFFKRLEFNYVVFDEAHMLKNMASQRYSHLMRIKAPRRLLLTGTPLQNNLVELMSLLIFAMPHMFSGKIEQIKQMFSCVSKASGNKNTYEKNRIEHAKHIMKPFVLRRLKKDVLKELPVKVEETKFCPMVEDQAKKYEELIKRFSAEVQEESSEEKDSTSSGSGMMMQLRRAANHPLLLRRFFDDDKLLTMSKLIIQEPTYNQSDPNIVFEDMSFMSDFELHKLCLQYKSLKAYVLPDSAILNSGKFKVLDELMPELIKEDHRILLFSQFTMVLDIVQEYMNIKKYKYLRLDGQVPVPERQQLIDDFNNDPEILVFLLSTRAGGLGINLTAADTVILHDIDFNPYNDKQAEDRCHRVGQIRDVRVFRFVSENSIEEGILQRAKDKLKLEKDIHDEGDDEENDTASVAMLLRDALGLKSTKS